MTKIIEFCKKKWFIQLLGIIALGLLIWFFGALVAFGGYVPLESDNARLLTILIIVVLWGLNNLRQQVQANRATALMVQDLTAAQEHDPAAQLVKKSDEEVAVLHNHFIEALQLLKKTQSKTAHGSQYLYDLPWYMLIGPPGSGKTTALMNSGLEFPLANKLGKGAVQGVGGTRYCDWWFTDQAVLIDTAGRYTTQDSHEAIDKAAWLGFLGLLKKYRPRRPVNGVLIAMSLADLLKQTETERLLHAQAIRQRIDELYEQFGIRFPIYMIFTKGDLIAGFTDFFADLSKDECNQVWGVTFPKENQLQPTDVLARVAADFDELLTRLQTRLPKRLQEERNLQRRALIFGFPQRVALLKENLLLFLQECYGTNRYQTAPYLRGIYFTSGTQEGNPIDRLMGLLAQTFQLDRVNTPLYSGKGKSYFLSRLLKEVIFSEALLVGVNQRVERMQTLLRRGTYTLAVLLTLVMTLVWFTSYNKNQAAITSLSEKIQDYETLAAAKAQQDLSTLVDRMNAMRTVAAVYSDDAPWLMTFGLYQGNKLQAVSQDTYQQLLQKQFLPLIKTRLEERLKGTEASNPEILYQLLKVYLMLGEPKRLEVAFMRPWLAIDWQQNPDSSDLLKHLDNLLKLPPEVQQLDAGLIAATRQILNRIPVAQQIYMRLKSEAAQDASRDFQLDTALRPNGNRVFATRNGTLTQQTIPYLFTYDGFYQLYLKQSKALAKESVSQNWVLGDEAQTEIIDADDVELAMRDFYYADYIQYWDALLANLKIKPINNIQASVEVLQYVAAPDSPLRKLLTAVSKETSLTHTPDNALAVDNALATADKAKKVGESLTSIDGRMTRLLGAAQVAERNRKKTEPLGKPVEDHFKPLTTLVAGANGAMPLDQTMTKLNALYGEMIDAGNTVNSGGVVPAKGPAAKALKMEAATLPMPLKKMAETRADGSSQSIEGEANVNLNKLWQSEVIPVYKNAIEGRYPLKKNSKEIALQDFSHFFAKNGVLDSFFTTHLAKFVNTSGKTWKANGIDVSAAVLAQFQYAEKVRQIFFQGGQTALVKFNVKPVSLDPNATKFWLNIEGQQSEYTSASPSKSMPMQWPGTDGSRMVSFGFETKEGKKPHSEEQGAWALFRLLDKLAMQKTVQDSYIITFSLDGLKASYELSANSVDNPFASNVLQNIRLPQSLD